MLTRKEDWALIEYSKIAVVTIVRVHYCRDWYHESITLSFTLIINYISHIRVDHNIYFLTDFANTAHKVEYYMNADSM